MPVVGMFLSLGEVNMGSDLSVLKGMNLKAVNICMHELGEITKICHQLSQILSFVLIKEAIIEWVPSPMPSMV